MSSSITFNNSAFLSAKRGDHHQAIKLYEKAYSARLGECSGKVDSHHIRFSWGIAASYEALGNIPSAIKYFKQASLDHRPGADHIGLYISPTDLS